MPFDLLAYPPRSNNPFAIAHQDLITAIANVKAPAPIGVANPEPRDFNDVTEYALALTALFDKWLAAIGAEVAANSYCALDLSQFEGRITDAVEGWATGEINRAAGACEQEILEGVR